MSSQAADSANKNQPSQQQKDEKKVSGSNNNNGQLKNTVAADSELSSAEAAAMANEINVNFMSKFRDKDTRVLKNLNSTQFMEVWNNYDKDGEYLSLC